MFEATHFSLSSGRCYPIKNQDHVLPKTWPGVWASTFSGSPYVRVCPSDWVSGRASHRRSQDDRAVPRAHSKPNGCICSKATCLVYRYGVIRRHTARAGWITDRIPSATSADLGRRCLLLSLIGHNHYSSIGDIITVAIMLQVVANALAIWNSSMPAQGTRRRPAPRGFVQTG